MAVDPRITKAKKVLKHALETGEVQKEDADSRSTGLRHQFKTGWEGAQDALEVLSAPRKR